MPSIELTGWTALVTGGGSGIGYEISRELAARGVGLVLSGRDVPRLEASAQRLRTDFGVAIRTVAADLCAPDGVSRLWAAVAEAPPDILVANAGAGLAGSFETLDRERQLDEIRLNVLAVTDLVHRALPSLRTRGRGRILLLGSTAAFQPGPFMSVYYATKAYVLSLGRALSEELRGSGVTVTVLCPGPTRSEFFDRAGMDEQSPLKRLRLMATEPVARLGVQALLKGRREVVAGRLNRVGTWLGRFLPTGLVLRAVAFLQRPQA